MSTTTRPRPAANRPRPVTIGSPEATLEAVRRLISTTKRQVTMAKNGEANRSTKMQRAQRLKADAFDRLGDLIAGR